MLQAKYNCILNPNQFVAPNKNIIQNLFSFYKFIKVDYGIFDKNKYNIDKNCIYDKDYIEF